MRQKNIDVNMQGFSLIVILLLIILIIAGYFLYKNNLPKISRITSPQNYEECLSSPWSLLQESFPAVCVAKSGARFIQPLTPEQQQDLAPPSVDQNQK